MKKSKTNKHGEGPTSAEHAAFRSLQEAAKDIVAEREAGGYFFPLPPTMAEISVAFRKLRVLEDDGGDNGN